MRDIGTAIDYLHRIDIAHRDIKVPGGRGLFARGADAQLVCLTCPVLCVSSPAGEPAVHIDGQNLRPQTNRLWFCEGDHAAQLPPDPLLHPLLCG